MKQQQGAENAHSKVNKNKLLQRAAIRANMPVSEMKKAYNGFVDEIAAALCGGNDVALTGFGTFGLKVHKGHPVRFEARDGKVQDYIVMKFAASDVLMSRIRTKCDVATLEADSEKDNVLPEEKAN